MAYFNNVVLLGNITYKGDTRYLPGKNTPVVKFRVAANKKVEDKETVCFIDVVVFGHTADYVAKYLNVGDLVHISGELVYNEWEKDGIKQSRHEIHSNSVQCISKSKKKTAAGAE